MILWEIDPDQIKLYLKKFKSNRFNLFKIKSN